MGFSTVTLRLSATMLRAYILRGANFDTSWNFQKVKRRRHFTAAKNYRSTPEILELAIIPFHTTNTSSKNTETVSNRTVSFVLASSHATFCSRLNFGRPKRIMNHRDEEVYTASIKLAVHIPAHYHSMEIQMDLPEENPLKSGAAPSILREPISQGCGVVFYGD
jgi:hypothetical protein